MTPRARMVLIIDENVPEAVTEFLRTRGHTVFAIRDYLGRGAPDAAVASFADDELAIVVTWDKDFKQLVQRIPTGNRATFRRLGRISFGCRESNGLQRIKHLIEYIEFAFEVESRNRDRRLIVEIAETSFRIVR